METEQIFAALEAELTAFTEQRSPAYLRQALENGCYVYGAGGYGRRILALLRAQGFACHGVIDRKFTGAGEQVDGVPALPLSAVGPAQAAARCLVVGVHNQTVLPGEIVAYGHTLGFGNVLWNADLPDVLGPKADNYWLTRRDFIAAHFPQLRATALRLADNESIAVLAALIRYRVTGDAASYPPADITQQYFPDGMMNFSQPICFVDGGAYTGDSYAYLKSREVNIQDWVAFEPDPANFSALTAFAATQTTPSTIFPCDLSDNFTHLRFAPDGGSSSHLNPSEGGITVSCVALDEVIHGKKPDYIKLDIEGAERAALLGMRKTIAAAKPHLAISAYHRPEDLWVLPETMAELAPYADLYLRQHAANAFDTVLYAVPHTVSR